MSNDNSTQVRPFPGVELLNYGADPCRGAGLHYCRCQHNAVPVITREAGEVQKVQRKIATARAEDKACRVPGVSRGVYGIANLEPFSRLAHGVPVIRNVGYEGQIAVTFDRAESNAAFRDRLRVAVPYLANFDMKAHGICLAGGAISGIFLRSTEDRMRFGGQIYHDIDAFLYGHKDDDAAAKAINALRDHLCTQWHGSEVTVYRTQGCITFYCGNPPRSAFPDEESYGYNTRRCPSSLLVQIVLRRYSTTAEIIHGFDLGSSAFLWDGAELTTTAVGKLAAEHGVNVLNLDARRASYEKRLSRYFDRGFDLVLPHLDACGLISLNGRLPYLFASAIQGSCACCVLATRLTATRPGFTDDGQYQETANGVRVRAPSAATEAESDYAIGQIAYGSSRAILMRNARGAGYDEVRPAALCASAVLTPDLDITKIDPEFDVEMMTNIVGWAIGGDSVRIGAAKALLGKDHLTDLMVELIASGKKPTRGKIEQMCSSRARILKLKAAIPFKFMTVEDKTALTGPFPRSLVSLEEWYGAVMVGAAFRD